LLEREKVINAFGLGFAVGSRGVSKDQQEFKNKPIHIIGKLDEAHLIPQRPPRRVFVCRGFVVQSSFDGTSCLANVNGLSIRRKVRIHAAGAGISEASLLVELFATN